MASTDARPVPRKNAAFRVTFPLLDADGDLVTGAAGLDSEVSKDGGTFTDCTNEATEIATSSGMYFLDLTSTEMNADTVAIIVKTSTSGAKTTAMVLYPEESGDYRADVVQWNGSAVATPTISGVPEVDITHYNGVAGTFASGRPEVNVSHVGGSAQNITTRLDATISSRASQASLDTVDDFLDTEVAAIKAKTDQLAFTTANRVDAQVFGMQPATVTAFSVATGAIDADALAADAVAELAAGISVPTAADIADAVHDAIIEGSYTLRKYLRGFAAVLMGRVTGGGTATEIFRDVADSKPRITAAVDGNGNRNSITLDLD